MRPIRIFVLFALAGAGACSSANDVQGPVEVLERRNNQMCVGVDATGNLVVLPPLSNGTCPAGFDLRTWT